MGAPRLAGISHGIRILSRTGAETATTAAVTLTKPAEKRAPAWTVSEPPRTGNETSRFLTPEVRRGTTRLPRPHPRPPGATSSQLARNTHVPFDSEKSPTPMSSGPEQFVITRVGPLSSTSSSSPRRASSGHRG